MSGPVERLASALGAAYRIERELGEGGMATVYLAEDVKHKRKVALKVLKPDESFVVPSPDGRWFAYLSDHSGRPELYLRALTGSDVQLQVSIDGASEPVWSRDGREIFYRRAAPGGSELVAAALELKLEPRVLTRTRLFDISAYDTAAPHANHVVVFQNVPELERRIARGDAGAR